MTSLMDERSCVNCKHDLDCTITPESFYLCFDKVGEPKVTAYLDYWWTQDVFYEKIVIWGTAYNSKEVFDSCMMHTHWINNQSLYEGQLVRALNGDVYRLGRKREV